RAFPPCRERRVADRARRSTRLRDRRLAGGDERIGVGERRRHEDNGVDDGEDRGAGAERQREREDGGKRARRRAPEVAQEVQNVDQHRASSVSPNGGAAVVISRFSGMLARNHPDDGVDCRPERQPRPTAARWRVVLPAAIFVLTAIARTWHINRHFAMLGDQIRDWGIALGPFTSLPLVGPATHVGGYTIGPAFYWILWSIRLVVGPWFDNLPHGGGIGQALLYSGSDALLLMALWRRTGSPWVALTAVVLLATAPFDLALSAVIWNPVVGSILARTATALVLFEWHRRSLAHTAVTAAIAWSAVHAYTGAIFVALGVFAALLVEEGVRRNWRGAIPRAGAIAAIVAALQLPYLIQRAASGVGQPAMGAVTGSIAGVARGRNPLRVMESGAAYVHAVGFIEFNPWYTGGVGWI